MCCATESAGSKNDIPGNNSFKIGKRNGRCVLDKVNTSMLFSKCGVIIFLTIFFDASILKPRNFEGKIKSLDRSAATALTVTIDGVDYTVQTGEKTQILNNKKEPASLSRFVVGDAVRMYGAISENATTTISNPEIIRNMSL